MMRDHPCFDNTGSTGITTQGQACVRLSAVLAAFPEAYEARQALGDPFNPERNARALRILQGLPARMQSKILSADAGKRSDANERGGRA
jgi:hypothetical protein